MLTVFLKFLTSDEMKDDYFTRRLVSTALAVKIIEHYKRLPTLNILARQPFICWMIAQVFTHSFSCEDYGENPPRLTPFYIHIMIIQTNRKLEFYYGKSDDRRVRFMLLNVFLLLFWLLHLQDSVSSVYPLSLYNNTQPCLRLSL